MTDIKQIAATCAKLARGAMEFAAVLVLFWYLPGVFILFPSFAIMVIFCTANMATNGLLSPTDFGPFGTIHAWVAALISIVLFMPYLLWIIGEIRSCQRND